MGSAISKATLFAFEILNEAFTGIAGGALGVYILLQSGLTPNQIVPTVLMCSITFGSIVYVLKDEELVETTENKLIFISGCDTGLGYSFAQHTADLGFEVFAGCLNQDSNGAVQLKKYSRRLHVVSFDLTDLKSIRATIESIEEYLKDNLGSVLWAVVNNAGVMTFGEFEWLTSDLISQQISINLQGTLLLSKAFCPILRKYKGRIITVTSHCAQAVLPGLSVYGATKAALAAWSDGFRVEMSKYGVNVITFIPGSFVNQSNIMARQTDKLYEMQTHFTPEQKLFYGDYFKRYTAYLSMISGPKIPKRIKDKHLYKKFEMALKDVHPASKYVNESFRYKMYHLIFSYSPAAVRDFFILRFMQMPEYKPESQLPDIIA